MKSGLDVEKTLGGIKAKNGKEAIEKAEKWYKDTNQKFKYKDVEVYADDFYLGEEISISESSYDLIPYYVLSKLIEDNYDAVVSTNEYNWVQQGRFNIISNETIDVNNVNYLIQKQGYLNRLKKISETPSGKSFRYKFVRA